MDYNTQTLKRTNNKSQTEQYLKLGLNKAQKLWQVYEIKLRQSNQWMLKHWEDLVAWVQENDCNSLPHQLVEQCCYAPKSQIYG